MPASAVGKSGWRRIRRPVLGIIVPDLAGCRALLQDTLDDVLQPSAQVPNRRGAAALQHQSRRRCRATCWTVGVELLRLLVCRSRWNSARFSLIAAQSLLVGRWSARPMAGNASMPPCAGTWHRGQRWKRATRYARHYAGQGGTGGARTARRSGCAAGVARRTALPLAASAWAGVLPKTPGRAGWLSATANQPRIPDPPGLLEELRKLADP